MRALVSRYATLTRRKERESCNCQVFIATSSKRQRFASAMTLLLRECSPAFDAATGLCTLIQDRCQLIYIVQYIPRRLIGAHAERRLARARALRRRRSGEKFPPFPSYLSKTAINQAVIISSEDLSSSRRLVCLEARRAARSRGSPDRGG